MEFIIFLYAESWKNNKGNNKWKQNNDFSIKYLNFTDVHYGIIKEVI